MVFDSIASIPMPTSKAKESTPKKKRANRSAKLKQCKLDARREQWLSQVKNKGVKEELNHGEKIGLPSMHESCERGKPIGKLEINSGGEENEGLMSHNYSDSESSPSNSPTSSVLGINGSGTNFTGSSSSGSSTSSSSNGGCCSGSMSEEDEADDDCLDDWEAMADALASDDSKDEPDNPNLESPEHRNDSQFDSAPAPNPEEAIQIASGNSKSLPHGRAWTPDDTCRPQSLPKQSSLPKNSGRHCGREWVCTNMVSVPSLCPICLEDLDLTDTSFLPCSCGYQLCLFCHKRIVEDNGRCPGCRKQYDQPIEVIAPSDWTSKIARSFSMNARP